MVPRASGQRLEAQFTPVEGIGVEAPDAAGERVGGELELPGLRCGRPAVGEVRAEKVHPRHALPVQRSARQLVATSQQEGTQLRCGLGSPGHQHAQPGVEYLTARPAGERVGRVLWHVHPEVLGWQRSLTDGRPGPRPDDHFGSECLQRGVQTLGGQGPLPLGLGATVVVERQKWALPVFGEAQGSVVLGPRRSRVGEVVGGSADLSVHGDTPSGAV